MKTHELKTWPQSYEAIKSGEKTFEYRLNDRDYKVGDLLLLRNFDPNTKQYLNDEILVKVTYIVYGGVYGIPKDYCIMAIRKAR